MEAFSKQRFFNEAEQHNLTFSALGNNPYFLKGGPRGADRKLPAGRKTGRLTEAEAAKTNRSPRGSLLPFHLVPTPMLHSQIEL